MNGHLAVIIIIPDNAQLYTAIITILVDSYSS